MVRNIVTGKNKWAVGSGQWAVLRKRRRGFLLPTAHCTLPTGFTLLELMIVITIIIILAAIVLPQYQKTILASREAVLRDDLFRMRTLLDQYAADKQKLPQDLNDLVTEKYMRELPQDPMTGQPDWATTTGPDPNLTSGGDGIIDIHSSSSDTSADGTAYSTW